MMSETYVECLVKKKASSMLAFLRILSVMLSVAFILIGFLIWPAFIIGVILAVVSYFVFLNADLEYEYLYLDREVSIDKVMAKTKRKKVDKFDLERMEIFAPLKSYHLDDYRKRNVKTKDYSSGVEQQPEKRYVMYYEGNVCVILEPSPEMVKAMKNVAPRKVFTD